MSKGFPGTISDYVKAGTAIFRSGMLKNLNSSAIKKAIEMNKAGCSRVAVIFSVLAEGIPDRTAIIFRDEKISYRELNSRMNRLARGMMDMGIKPGDRMVLMCSNSSAFIEFTGATSKLGISVVPVSTSLKTKELAYIMENSNSKGIIFSAKLKDIVSEAISLNDNISKACSIIAGEKSDKDFISYDEILYKYTDEEIIINTKKVESPVVLYTSGTTGRPKGAVRDPNKVSPIVFPLMMYDFNLTRDDIFYTPCPLYHAAPTAFIPLCMFTGCAMVISEKFDSHEALNLMEKYKVTLALMVPTHYSRLSSLPQEEFSKYNLNLRGLISTGSNFAPSLKIRISERFGDIIYDLYGGAEVGMTMLAKPEIVAKHPDSIGKPMTGTGILLLDESGEKVRSGEPGEIYVKSRAVFDGYYKNKNATDESTKRGYFSIGDVARKGEDGCYFLCDRVRDMIISGGVNIYPKEIEDVLITYKAVDDVAVIGAPSEEWGEIVVAFVSLIEGEKATAEEIQDFVGENLAGYKKPRAVFFMSELPRNPQGKLLKKDLRERLKAGEFPISK